MKQFFEEWKLLLLLSVVVTLGFAAVSWLNREPYYSIQDVENWCLKNCAIKEERKHGD